MPCFIRICPHYHPSEFSNAKVLLCIRFGAALLCLPMTCMKLACSALQCCLCHLTVSFLYWAVVPSRCVWIFYILSDSSTESHTSIHTLIMHSAPVTETFFIFPWSPTWMMLHFEWPVSDLGSPDNVLYCTLSTACDTCLWSASPDTPSVLNF